MNAQRSTFLAVVLAYRGPAFLLRSGTADDLRRRNFGSIAPLLRARYRQRLLCTLLQSFLQHSVAATAFVAMHVTVRWHAIDVVPVFCTFYWLNHKAPRPAAIRTAAEPTGSLAVLAPLGSDRRHRHAHSQHSGTPTNIRHYAT